MLTLFFAPPSPYARKVRVLIEEKGLEGRVRFEQRAPFDKPADLIAVNPLSKVPSLVTDDGLVVYDSPAICEYLDGLAAPRLIPGEGRARWEALRRQALADGILDAGVSVILEGRRPESERSPAWVARQLDVIDRSLSAFESEIAVFTHELTIAHIALGCTLGWLDFRMPTRNWRASNPRLAEWERTFAARPSMMATRPS